MLMQEFEKKDQIKVAIGNERTSNRRGPASPLF